MTDELINTLVTGFPSFAGLFACIAVLYRIILHVLEQDKQKTKALMLALRECSDSQQDSIIQGMD